MINLTKEQIKEALLRLKGYSYWMYYDEDGINSLKNQKIQHKNHVFSIDVLENGYIKATIEDGRYALFEVKTVIAPPEKGLDNFTIRVRIVSCAYDTETWNYFEEIKMFVASFWQRLNAFTFFVRMQDETIDKISDALVTLNK